ncbi:unnamed protein product [Caretta caretta]
MTISASRWQPCEAISAGAQAEEEEEGELAAALFGCGRCGCDLTHSGRVSRSASLQLTRGQPPPTAPKPALSPQPKRREARGNCCVGIASNRIPAPLFIYLFWW